MARHTGQHEKRLGPAWTGKGAPVPGTFRKREAQAALNEILVEARKGARRQERTGVTFADVADDWFERGRFERDWSASTQVDYRSVLDTHLVKAFGTRRIETITSEHVQKWRDKFARETDDDGEPLRARKTVNKIVTQLHAVFEHAIDHHGLVVNPVAKVKRLRESNDPARYDFFSPEEVDLLVVTAAAGKHRDPNRPAVSETEQALRSFEDQQDAAIYLTAALSGLRRGELLALRWADVDFEQSSIRVYEGFSANVTGKTKSRKSRTVPMVDKVDVALREVKQRDFLTGKTNLVFVSRERTNVDGSALRRRYIATLDAAGLRRLRFHEYADVVVMRTLARESRQTEVLLTQFPKSLRVSRSRFRWSGASRSGVDGRSVGGRWQRRSCASPGGQGRRFAASVARPCRAAIDSPAPLR